MKSDLKNLASQQEIYFSDYGRYSNDPEELSFVTSSGVDVTIFLSRDGWAAAANHAALGDRDGCAIYVDDAPEYRAGLILEALSGEIVCQSD